jgi:16S rRNA (cytidine1402-2'-O)-methyltransferase
VSQDKVPQGKGTLYVVATPIGNLGDITRRALDVLRDADVIAAEDTRNTGHLLNHYALRARQLVALHEHNERAAAEKLIGLLAEGKSVALVSDAGTPAVSDPGARLVADVRAAGFKVVPLPGANAAVAAVSAAGLDSAHFLFYGFLPSKSTARRKALAALVDLPYPIIFYEAPHRILECVVDLEKIFGAARSLTIAREITKLFETIHTCPLGEALAWMEADPNQQRGEFVLIVEGAPSAEEGVESEAARRTLQLLLAELPLKQAVKLAVSITGGKKNEIYDMALKMKGEGL